MLEMAINNVDVGSLKDRVHIVTFCGGRRYNGRIAQVTGGVRSNRWRACTPNTHLYLKCIRRLTLQIHAT